MHVCVYALAQQGSVAVWAADVGFTFPLPPNNRWSGTRYVPKYIPCLQPPHVIFCGGWEFDNPVSWEKKEGGRAFVFSRDGSRVREFASAIHN
jgi:hypothetical protein